MAILNMIKLEGSNFEIGLQHGKKLKNKIKEFLNDDFARINKLLKIPYTEGELLSKIQEYKGFLKENVPDFYEEIEGIAVGSDITVDESVLLQYRREIIGVNSFTLTGDCTSFAHHNADTVVVGQTIDLNGDMTDLGNVFSISPNKVRDLEIIQYSFAGLMGYMGMNNFGLSVAINLVVSDNWGIGLSPYLLSRKFLECSSVEECIDIIKNISIASSRSFLITDKNRAVNIEITPSSYSVDQNNYLSHTNHFIQEKLLSYERLNIFSKNSSIKRKEVIDFHLKEKYDFESIENAFKDHSLFPVGICAHNKGNIKLNETVASIIMYPKNGFFYPH